MTDDLNILFLCSGGPDIKPSPVVFSQLRSITMYIQKADIFPIKSGVSNYVRSIWTLRKHLQTNPYRIIHAHYGLCGIVALFGRRDQKIVVSFMGDDIVGTIGNKGQYTLAGKLVAMLNIFLARHWYDYVIVKSNNLLSRINRVENIAVIPNGVNLNAFYELDKKQVREKLGLSAKKKYIIFVSNSSRPEKNYELARQAVSLLDESDVELLPLCNIPNQDLVFYYNAADCLILTSFHEGSPNVIKEAMACNCPIVSTDVGDVRRVFGNTKGCLIGSFDPIDFAQKIKIALDFATKKGRTLGRKRILELGLDSETIARKIISVYQKIFN